MSRRTRRHPGRAKPAPAIRLVRIEAGAYLAPEHGIRIENRNDGKRDACWVAFRTNDGKTVCSGGSLREVRKKLEKHLLVVVRADGKRAPRGAPAPRPRSAPCKLAPEIAEALEDRSMKTRTIQIEIPEPQTPVGAFVRHVFGVHGEGVARVAARPHLSGTWESDDAGSHAYVKGRPSYMLVVQSGALRPGSIFTGDMDVVDAAERVVWEGEVTSPDTPDNFVERQTAWEAARGGTEKTG